MSSLKTRHLGIDTAHFEIAARLLSDGELVAFPTETVYGLGADARNNLAVARIFAAKTRPKFNPLIVHVASLSQARKIAEFNPQATALAQAFWPGPLTLVLPLRRDAGIAPLVTAGLESIAVRVPSSKVARSLLTHFSSPIAAPSANLSGRISPTCAAHVRGDLGGKIAAIIDGGLVALGIESTVIVADDPMRLLRYGSIAPDEIRAITGQYPVSDVTPDIKRAPGQIRTHYAPAAKLRINASSPEPNEIYIAFGPACDLLSEAAPKALLELSPKGCLIEAAANLFDCLHRADKLAGENGRIAVAPIPAEGIGLAINDRLWRAATPKP